MKEVTPICEPAGDFLRRVVDDPDNELQDAKRLVIYYQVEDGWRCLYLRMNDYHFAWAGAAMLAESRSGTTREDLGEV